MNLFFLNVFLALVWALLQGALRAENVALGFVLGYAIIGLSHRTMGSSRYTLKVVQVLRLIAFVAWEIFTASLALAWLVVQPRLRLRPAVVAVELAVETDVEIVMLANLITLSPGTLSMDISADRKTLFVHTIDLDDAEAFCRKIKNGLERQVLEVMR